MSTNIIEIPYAGDNNSNYYDIEREINRAYYERGNPYEIQKA